MIAVVAYGTIVALFLCWWLSGFLQRVSKAATCERGKKLAYNNDFCSGGEKQHSLGAKRIEAIKRSMREHFAVPEELKRRPYPA
jgi:hypothetical protein